MNIDEVFKLMTILEKSTQWPEFRAIHDEAYIKIKKAAKEALEELKKEREEEAKEEAEKVARAQAEAKAKADKAKDDEPMVGHNVAPPPKPNGIERRV